MPEKQETNSSMPAVGSGEKNPSEYTDQEWEDLYREVYPMVLHWILEHKGPYEWARELCHDAFIVFFRKLHDPDFSIHCKPSTFIVAITKKLFLNKIRKEKPHLIKPPADNPEPLQEASLNIHQILEENKEKERLVKTLQTAMEALGEPCREILRDFYFHNLDMQQIANKFGYTNADNAKTQKYKCLQRLKKYFFNIANSRIL